MIKHMARKPILKRETYLKYGFVLTERERPLCPQCGSVLNAGPGYQPKRCGQCGQKIAFKKVTWKEEKPLRYMPS